MESASVCCQHDRNSFVTEEKMESKCVCCQHDCDKQIERKGYFDTVNDPKCVIDCNIGNLFINVQTSTPGNPKNEDETIRNYLLEKMKMLCSKVNRFTPATWNCRHEVDIEHMFTDLVMLKENRQTNVKKPTTIQNVLDVIKSTHACRVFIDGEGGIGKSTLLRFLAYNWANDLDETFKGKLLFLVKIRDIKESVLNTILKCIDVEEFALKTDLKPGSELIKRFIMKNDHEIVLFLDGLDELEDDTKSPISLFKKEQLINSKVIITSRLGSENEFVKVSDVHVNVKGFNGGNIERYIMKYFEYRKKPELGDWLISELILDESKRTDSKQFDPLPICKNPMLLLSVCAIWEDKHYLPTDKSELFKEVFRCILNTYIDKHEFPKTKKISVFEKTPAKYIHAMLVLGKCMYESLKTNKLCINKDNLEGDEQVVEMALKLGFVYEDASIYKDDFEEVFTPPHKLIVESLVGFYISNLCKVDSLTGGFENPINKLKPLGLNEWEVIRINEHLEMARMFATGFLGAEAGKFLKHWITENLSTFSLMAYLNHVKEENRISVEKTITDYISEHSFEMKPHILDICNSLWTCIHYIDPTVNENWTFLQLIRKAKEVQDQIVNLLKRPQFMKMPPKFLGKVIAHLFIVFEDQNVLFEDNIHLRNEGVVNVLLDEFHKLSFQYEIPNLINNSLHPSLLTHIMFRAPNISALNLNNCHVTGSLMNRCSKKYPKCGVFKLECLDISDNDLSAIEGALLADLLIMSPNLRGLNITNCRLSGFVMNDMVAICISRLRVLNLEELYISNNDLSAIEGASLASLLGLAPNLNYIDIKKCKLSGSVVNDMVKICSNKQIEFILEKLNISENNLSEIEGGLLASFLVSCPTLSTLQMNRCSLSGVVVNDMVKKCLRKNQVLLKLIRLDISDNDLSAIEGALLADLLMMSPNLCGLNITNCRLSGFVMNDIVEVCTSRNVVLSLEELYISNNDLSAIEGASLASLLGLKVPNMNCIDVQNCRLSGFVVNDMVRICSKMEVKLSVLENLNISNNNLSAIEGTSLASLLDIFPTLRTLRMSRCCLSGGVVNDMMGVFSSTTVLNLEELNINSNNLSAIEGAVLARLLMICPALRTLEMSRCSLRGGVVNDMVGICVSDEVMSGLTYLDISNNYLFNRASPSGLRAMAPDLHTIIIDNYSKTTCLKCLCL